MLKYNYKVVRPKIEGDERFGLQDYVPMLGRVMNATTLKDISRAIASRGSEDCSASRLIGMYNNLLFCFHLGPINTDPDCYCPKDICDCDCDCEIGDIEIMTGTAVIWQAVEALETNEGLTWDDDYISYTTRHATLGFTMLVPINDKGSSEPWDTGKGFHWSTLPDGELRKLAKGTAAYGGCSVK